MLETGRCGFYSLVIDFRLALPKEDATVNLSLFLFLSISLADTKSVKYDRNKVTVLGESSREKTFTLCARYIRDTAMQG